MRFLDNRFSVDAALNLALEEAVFRGAPEGEDIFMLWQNSSAAVVGRNQVTRTEVDLDYASKNGIQVVRRASGGGAVYHDMGNLNYSHITGLGAGGGGFKPHEPIVRALREFGVEARPSGRNDLTVDGRKVSGSSTVKAGARTLTHGTILFDVNLETLQRVLTPSQGKLEKRGIKSVESRVMNLRGKLENVVDIEGFRNGIVQILNKYYNSELLRIEPKVFSLADKLMRERYLSADWNLGKAAPEGLRRCTKVFDFGEVSVSYSVDGGLIRGLSVSGDFFSDRDASELSAIFDGVPVDGIDGLKSRVDIGEYVKGMDWKSFSMLFGGAYGIE